MTTFHDTVRRAEALSEAQQWQAAAMAWQEIVENNPVNGDYWVQLGLARYENQDFEGSIQAWHKVHDLGGVRPFLSAYNIACCYALLGDKIQAMQWVERAFDLRFNNLAAIQEDDDLNLLHDEPRFQELTAQLDISSMSRDEGFRYDLNLLVQQVKRLGYAPFRFVSEDEFDGQVQQIHERIPHLTDTQVIIELMKLLRLVGDGHTTIRTAPNTRPEFAHAIPIRFYQFGDALWIISAAPEHRQILGQQIIEIDDQSVSRILLALDPLLSRDNRIWTSEIAMHMMRFPAILHGLGLLSAPDRITLSLQDRIGHCQQYAISSDTRFPDTRYVVYPDMITLAQTLPQPIPLYLRNRVLPYWFEYLPDEKLLYFQYNRVQDAEDESTAAFCNRLFDFVDTHDVSKLVVDVRWNSGGNTYLHMPIVHHLIAYNQVKPKGELFVIIGRRTYSAAMNFVTLLDRHTDAIFVGEPTGSSPNFVGEGVMTTLPYSGLSISTSDLYWQSSWPTDHRPWIAPHIYVPPSIETAWENRDPALETIMSL